MAVGNHEQDLDIRASNAEREQVIAQLRQHLADGRLTIDEFSDRMTEVYEARTRRDLERPLRQLPVIATRGDEKAARREARRIARMQRWQRRRKDFAGFATPNIICTVVWAMTTPGGYFWPEWVLLGTGVGYIGRVISGESKNQRRQRKLEAHRARFHDHRLGETPGIPAPTEEDVDGRFVSTVMFVDIVGSTEHAAAMGDARWRELLDEHDERVRKELDRWQGRTIFTKGDEVVAAFDLPAKAVHCACAIRSNARSMGLEVRAGVHAGEIDRRGDDVSGLALHIGQRVSGQAEPGEVLVSSTVKELAAGSGIRFDDRGVHALRGVPDEWRLYAVALD